MKKYFYAFIAHFIWLYLVTTIGFFLITLLICFSGLVISGSDCVFPLYPYLGLLMPAAVNGLYGVYIRWKEPSELESYLDAQEDKDKIKQYVAEQKKDSSNTM